MPRHKYRPHSADRGTRAQTLKMRASIGPPSRKRKIARKQYVTYRRKTGAKRRPPLEL